MDVMPKNSNTNTLWKAVLFLLLFQTTSLADPVADPMYGLSSFMVLSSLLGLEAGIATIALLFFGMSPKPVFFAMLMSNAGMYFVAFLPIYEVLENLFIAELIIIFTEAALIKLIARFDVFQLDTFRKVGWVGAITVSVIANLLSYYVGIIITS